MLKTATENYLITKARNYMRNIQKNYGKENEFRM